MFQLIGERAEKNQIILNVFRIRAGGAGFFWLVFLLPEGLIMEFMSYLVILRIGLMGLTFSIYLRKVFGKEDPAALLFSTAYALSGYLAAYNWNVMWLDCLILLAACGTGAGSGPSCSGWRLITASA